MRKLLIIPQKSGGGVNPFILARIPKSRKNQPKPESRPPYIYVSSSLSFAIQSRHKCRPALVKSALFRIPNKPNDSCATGRNL